MTTDLNVLGVTIPGDVISGSTTYRVTSVDALTAKCGRCFEPCDRLRLIEGVGVRSLHEECEARLAAMGYVVTEERRRSERRRSGRAA